MNLVNIAYFFTKDIYASSAGIEVTDLKKVLQKNKEIFNFLQDDTGMSWCQIEFIHVINIHEIILHDINLNQETVLVDRTFQVLASLDGKSWDLVEISSVNKKNNLFEIKLSASKRCKYIKFLSQSKKLSLSQIQIFVNKSDNENIYLITDRRDGLCQRLIGLLEIMAISEYCGFNFAFSWHNNMEDNQFHDVKKVGDIFDIEFIDKHYVNNIDSDATKIRYGDVYYTPSINNIISNNEDFINYYILYNKIKFSSNIQSVIEYVKNLNLSKNLVGIHVRAGDIVYGEFRLNPMFFPKVLQYPFILDILNEQESENIILIGQDEDLMRYLKELYKIKLSKDYYLDNFSSLQKIFFDIEIFSRCQKIYGANSAPIVLASKLNNSDLIDIHQLLSDTEKINILKKWLLNNKMIANIPKQQIVYAAFAYLYYGFNIEDVESLAAINNIARSLDGGNKLYFIFEIILLYKQNNYKLAEKKVFDYIERYGTYEKPILGYPTLYLQKFLPKVAIDNLRYLESLEQLVKQNDNLPFAEILIGMSYYYIGDTNKSKVHFDSFKNQVNESDMPEALIEFFRRNV